MILPHSYLFYFFYRNTFLYSFDQNRYLLFKKYLGVYASVLSTKIEDSPKPLSEQEERIVSFTNFLDSLFPFWASRFLCDFFKICFVVNTADYCGKTTSQITSTVARVIEERFKDRIDLTQEAEAFSVVTSKVKKGRVK